jgi:hypothetical protein
MPRVLQRVGLGGRLMVTRRAVLKMGASIPIAGRVRAQTFLGGGIAPQVAQFFNRLQTLPSPANQLLYTNLINGLISDGIWSMLDVLCVAGGDPASSLINLVQQSYGGQAADVPFTPYQGFTLNGGTVSYISTQFNGSAGGTNFSQNSAMIAVGNLVGTQANQALLRTAADVSLEIWPEYSNGNALWMVNGASEAQAANPGDASGIFIASRTGSTASALYRNGTQLGTTAIASVSPENGILNVGYGGTAGWIASFWAIGAGLNSTQATALYNRINTYLTAIGA